MTMNIINQGWACPNCNKAHAPDVKTCPGDSAQLLAESHSVRTYSGARGLDTRCCGIVAKWTR